ncbi:MAG: AsmA family protein [Proteobacteria bacterium]|nr:AsmA family protein [Pseudomonadota bacterium]
MPHAQRWHIVGPGRAGARVLAWTLGAVALLAVAVLLFPWDMLRGPLGRYVSGQTGRHFEITRRLDVKPGWTTRVRMEGVTFANPEWAQDAYLLQAESAEFEVRLLPLLRGRLELPSLVLQAPQLGLQMEADGRRTWALGRDTADEANVPQIGSLAVDKGELHYIAPARGADIRMAFEVDPRAGDALPLSYSARGRWQGQAFSANGRTGSVLVLHAPLQAPFPLEVNALAGSTSLRATGTLASLASMDGADAAFELRGASLADLYRLVGVVLPETPRYAVNGRVARRGPVWRVENIRGRLGQSDLAGALAYDRSQAVPLLTGSLQSRVLDFDDLAPLVGLPEQPRSVAAAPAAPAARAAAARPVTPPGRVLPTATLDVQRLRAMDADVRYGAARISNARALPLERADIHVRLKGGVLNLDPLKLGVAGGQLAGRLRIDAASDTAAVAVNLDARGLQLNRLFPAVESTRSSLGRMAGSIDLAGRGNSAARMLATASGDVALLMGEGQISNLLLEFAGLDGGEIIKFLLRGDRDVRLRCAAAAFDVKQGVMTSRALVLDTVDTAILGTGTVSLVDESLDLVLRPSPKDASILSLRSPLKITGSFAAPRAGPDKAALAGRAGIALALGALNPLLALAATVETGPGVDANCPQVLAQAQAAAQPHAK